MWLEKQDREERKVSTVCINTLVIQRAQVELSPVSPFTQIMSYQTKPLTPVPRGWTVLGRHCVHLWRSVSSLLRESPTEAWQRDTGVNVRWGHA